VTLSYQVIHRTVYRYEREVAPSFSLLRVFPRTLAHQRCRSSVIEVDPLPDDYRERVDFFGNRVAYCVIEAPHRSLSVTAVSVVDVDDPGADRTSRERPWEQDRTAALVGPGESHPDAVAFTLDSPLVRCSPRVQEYAAASFAAGRTTTDAVADLASRIHHDYAYQPGSTSVTTRLEEFFDQREGVCQDFAHLMIACLRSMGLAARYVSGYLETDPPPGRTKLEGADVSHAWVGVHLPGSGWVDVDPTNDQFVNDRYVTNAWGRDYSDVAPLSGVIFTEGQTASLEVSVDVAVVPG